MTVLVGVDCATKPNKTGLALGRLEGGTVRIDHCAVGSSRRGPAAIILEWLEDAEDVVFGLDAPLGWPCSMGRYLCEHHAGEPIAVESNTFFRRVTDHEIRRRLGKQPLDVGADRIARTAVAALDLLSQLRFATGRAIPLGWSPDETEAWRAIEVYPAATRLAHGIIDQGGNLDGFAGVLDCSAVEEEARCSVDAADACACVLAVGDFLLGRAVPPDDLELAKIEGWIWASDRPQHGA